MLSLARHWPSFGPSVFFGSVVVAVVVGVSKLNVGVSESVEQSGLESISSAHFSGLFKALHVKYLSENF